MGARGFGVNIILKYFIFEELGISLILMRMLIIRIGSWCVCSVHASVPYAYAQHVYKGPFQVWNCYAYAEHTRKELICTVKGGNFVTFFA